MLKSLPLQVSVWSQHAESEQTSGRAQHPGRVFNMSDRFSDVLTIDYLLLTSNTFATEQNSKYKVVSSSKESPQELSDKPSYLPAKDKDIQSDQPFRPFSPEQFDLVSAETVETTRVAQRRNEKMKIIRKQQRDRLVNKPIKRLRKHIENVFEFWCFKSSWEALKVGRKVF